MKKEKVSKSRKVSEITNELVNSEKSKTEKFFNDNVIKELAKTITVENTVKKTTGKKEFWKKESKANFKTEKIARRKLRNLQTNLSVKVNSDCLLQSANISNSIPELIKFYNENCNHENFTIFTNKNDETGKDIDTIKKAIVQLKKWIELN